MATQFNLRQQLPSCYVTKDLLERLEDHLLSQAAEFTGLTEDQLVGCYHVSVVDNLGDEELASIKDFPAPLFPDNTRTISLELWISDRQSPLDQGLRVTLHFTGYRENAGVKISATANSARSRVVGLYDSFMRILEPCTNASRFYYPPALVEGLLWVVTPLVGMFSLIFVLAAFEDASRGGQTLAYLSVLAFLSLVAYYVGKRWRPYIAFDSRRAQHARKMADWLLLGWLTFLLFGTVLVFLRRQVFGF